MENTISQTEQTAAASLERNADEFVLVIAGNWLLGEPLPAAVELGSRGAREKATLRFDCSGLGEWDSALTVYLRNVNEAAEAAGFTLDYRGLPVGAARLLKLASSVAEPEGARRSVLAGGWLERIGAWFLDTVAYGAELLRFVGELVLSFRRLVRGEARYQRSDIFVMVQEAGAEAFPIVSLISFLIGMIFAFVGVIQLKAFGAGIYTADLVAIAMVREMAPIMTGIMMAGRTGAGYAAHLGTMKVNEEIDALTTLGIKAMDFLVLPRVIALVIMIPLLSLYASLMGIIGGAVVGVVMLDASVLQYAVQTEQAVGLNSLFGGLFKSLVYGFLVAVAGCQQGLACGSSAMAVGQATTRAVVNGIVLIVISASILTIIYINLGI